MGKRERTEILQRQGCGDFSSADSAGGEESQRSLSTRGGTPPGGPRV